MRGEHCIAGASILTGIALVLLIFANIGQVGSGALVNGIYFAEVNVEAYGAALTGATKKSAPGLYDTKNDALGEGLGLRQYYRYGIYRACGYQKDGSGICNSSSFGYPMEPMAQLLADTPKDYATQWAQIIPDSTFKDNTYNHNLSRIGGLFIFIGSALVILALVFGVLKHRIFFLVAAACSGLSALLLMIGAAMWSALIAKDSWLKIVHVEYGNELGIFTTAGASLYLTWVAFVLVTLSVLPYVVACCTFRRD